MSNSKVEIKIGEIEFQLEGENKWVDSQITNLLDRLLTKDTAEVAPASTPAPTPVVETPAKKEEIAKPVAKAPTTKAPVAKKAPAKEEKAPAKKAVTTKKAPAKKTATPKVDKPKATSTKAKVKAMAKVEANADTEHPLFNYLKTKDALGNQVRRFLATASFLTANGASRLNTSMIAEITKDARLAKFVNASDCLNKNEKKEYCIKDGKEFVITPKGIESLM